MYVYKKDNNIPNAIFVRACFIGYLNEFIFAADIIKLAKLENNMLERSVYTDNHSLHVIVIVRNGTMRMIKKILLNLHPFNIYQSLLGSYEWKI